MSDDLIEDPGPILDPGKGDKPVVVVPDVFHKIESPEDIDHDIAEALGDFEVSGFEVLLPAVQSQADGFAFLKIDFAEEDDLELLRERLGDGFEDALLPAVQAAEKLPFLAVKVEYSEPDPVGEVVVTDGFDLG